MRFLTLVFITVLASATLAQEIVIDDQDSGFSITLGSWTDTTTPLGWPGETGNYRYAFGTGGGTTAECEWRPNITSAGRYLVSIWYVNGGNRPADAPFTVHQSGGSLTVDYDQEESGGQWFPLGVFHFNTGTSGYVSLSNDAQSGQAVIADAVKFTPVPTPASEIRGVWSSRYQWPAVGQSAMQSSIDSLMTNLQNNNFNTVFFQIRGQCDTLYPSPYETWSPITAFGESDPGWDPVAYAVNAAHTRGVQFHAYINTHTIWGSTTPPTDLNHIYYDHGNPSDPAHRDWLLYDDAGNPANLHEYYYMNPGIPEADAWVRQQVMYVANTYDIDGVHWDRARMHSVGYGRNPIAVARWDNTATPASFDGPGNPDNLDWDAFMRDAVTRSLMNITGQLWEADSSILNSSAPIGMWRSDAYGYSYTFTGYTHAQDAKAWMERGAMDFVVPQIYWGNGEDTPHFNDLYEDWQAAADTHGRYMVPASSNTMRTATIGGSVPGYSDTQMRQHEVESHNALTRIGGAAGYNLWSSGSTQWSDWSASGGPYENPASFPAMPWRSTEGVIVGRVFEADGTTPVTDAWVTRTGDSWTALSAADGFYTFLRVAPGTYDLTVTHPVHGTANATGVSVTAGNAVSAELTFSAVPVGLAVLGQY